MGETWKVIETIPGSVEFALGLRRTWLAAVIFAVLGGGAGGVLAFVQPVPLPVVVLGGLGGALLGAAGTLLITIPTHQQSLTWRVKGSGPTVDLHTDRQGITLRRNGTERRIPWSMVQGCAVLGQRAFIDSTVEFMAFAAPNPEAMDRLRHFWRGRRSFDATRLGVEEGSTPESGSASVLLTPNDWFAWRAGGPAPHVNELRAQLERGELPLGRVRLEWDVDGVRIVDGGLPRAVRFADGPALRAIGTLLAVYGSGGGLVVRQGSLGPSGPRIIAGWNHRIRTFMEDEEPTPPDRADAPDATSHRDEVRWTYEGTFWFGFAARVRRLWIGPAFIGGLVGLVGGALLAPSVAGDMDVAVVVALAAAGAIGLPALSSALSTLFQDGTYRGPITVVARPEGLAVYRGDALFRAEGWSSIRSVLHGNRAVMVRSIRGLVLIPTSEAWPQTRINEHLRDLMAESRARRFQPTVHAATVHGDIHCDVTWEDLAPWYKFRQRSLGRHEKSLQTMIIDHEIPLGEIRVRWDRDGIGYRGGIEPCEAQWTWAELHGLTAENARIHLVARDGRGIVLPRIGMLRSGGLVTAWHKAIEAGRIQVDPATDEPPAPQGPSSPFAPPRS